jgi:hypothetical protein
MLNVIRALAFLGLLIALLFGSAGRWNLPFFWVYIVVGAITGFLSGPLVLGSWWAFAPVAPLVLLILRRVITEDHSCAPSCTGMRHMHSESDIGWFLVFGNWPMTQRVAPGFPERWNG